MNIFKDPVTDTDKLKKSLTGRIIVNRDEHGDFIAIDKLSVAEANVPNELKEIFVDGKLVVETSLQEIRNRLSEQIK